ncbi:MAG: hypothetical protein COV46_08060 [Deltaproteobacteria bacterium CG11_big_fil_rev_8_21_14_0_20_49_13]|nr:MAG: hypothetical protein COV46_08060 [Deltaproteobacteria bacterium CG11_big_fil_rev_8_21_14_0_20_49_13]
MSRKIRYEAGSRRPEAGLIHLTFLFLASCVLLHSSCADPSIHASEREVATVSRIFNATPNDAYYAVRWALKTDGYNINKEDLDNGMVVSGWLPSKVDSFYIDPFGPEHKDYGTNGAYYRLSIKITPEDGKTKVEVTSLVKSIVPHLRSSEIQEKKVLRKMADYLRKADIDVTNVGIEE